jgi:RNA polymerase sigma factor FliA
MPEALSTSSSRHELAKEHFGVVKEIAYGMTKKLPASVDVNDLIGAGSVGLMEAADSFDPDNVKGRTFKQWAKFRIRGAMLDALRELDHKSRGDRRMQRDIERAEHRLRHDDNGKIREVTREEVAAELGLDMDDFEDRRRHSQVNVHLDADELEIAEDRYVSAEERLGTTELGQLVLRKIDEPGVLNEQEREVIRLYHFEGMNLLDIGERLSLTESRICQINRAALIAIRKSCMAEDKGLAEYVEDNLRTTERKSRERGTGVKKYKTQAKLREDLLGELFNVADIEVVDLDDARHELLLCAKPLMSQLTQEESDVLLLFLFNNHAVRRVRSHCELSRPRFMAVLHIATRKLHTLLTATPSERDGADLAEDEAITVEQPQLSDLVVPFEVQMRTIELLRAALATNGFAAMEQAADGEDEVFVDLKESLGGNGTMAFDSRTLTSILEPLVDNALTEPEQRIIQRTLFDGESLAAYKGRMGLEWGEVRLLRTRALMKLKKACRDVADVKQGMQ